jgi:hypothetical protein
MNPMPENQSIEPLEPMSNNPSGKSQFKICQRKNVKILMLFVYYLGMTAAYSSILADAYFRGKVNGVLLCYALFPGMAVAILSGAILAWKTKNWFYLLASFVLPILILSKARA